MRFAVVLTLVLLIGPPASAETPPDRILLVPRARPEAPPPAPRPRVVPRPGPATTNAPSAPAAPLPAVLKPEEEKLFLDLAGTIGALAWMSGLCAPVDRPNPWRDRMERLVAGEGASLAIGDKLMGAYNAGFEAYALSHRTCTDATRSAQGLLLRDAKSLGRDLERRFGG